MNYSKEISSFCLLFLFFASPFRWLDQSNIQFSYLNIFFFSQSEFRRSEISKRWFAKKKQDTSSFCVLFFDLCPVESYCHCMESFIFQSYSILSLINSIGIVIAKSFQWKTEKKNCVGEKVFFFQRIFSQLMIFFSFWSLGEFCKYAFN